MTESSLRAQKLPVLEVEDLAVSLPPGGDRPNAVEHVSFTVNEGEVTCLIGESVWEICYRFNGYGTAAEGTRTGRGFGEAPRDGSLSPNTRRNTPAAGRQDGHGFSGTDDRSESGDDLRRSNG